MKKEERYLFPADYMADPSVHVFNGRLYIYPSHDRESGIPENDNGDHFDMNDYHVLSTDDVMHGEIVDHGVALKVADIPWAGRQLWDCDIACKDGKYYLYFPLKDRNDIFRMGVAISDKPEGPFIPQPDPIRGSYSIDAAVFQHCFRDAAIVYIGGRVIPRIRAANQLTSAGSRCAPNALLSAFYLNCTVIHDCTGHRCIIGTQCKRCTIVNVDSLP